MINKRSSYMYVSPIPEHLSPKFWTSMFQLKNIRETLPPCLTPFVTQKPGGTCIILSYKYFLGVSTEK